jgi:hypothetical protein
MKGPQEVSTTQVLIKEKLEDILGVMAATPLECHYLQSALGALMRDAYHILELRSSGLDLPDFFNESLQCLSDLGQGRLILFMESQGYSLTGLAHLSGRGVRHLQRLRAIATLPADVAHVVERLGLQSGHVRALRNSGRPLSELTDCLFQHNISPRLIASWLRMLRQEPEADLVQTILKVQFQEACRQSKLIAKRTTIQ